MAKQKAPWSVRGVSEEALTKAKAAAKSRRTFFGNWVNDALIAAADSEQRDGRTEAMAPGSTLIEPEWTRSLVVEPTADDAERRERTIRAPTGRPGVNNRPPEEKRKQQAPWSVRGVSDATQSKAKKSAADQHVTIGEWVSQALVAAADSELRAGAPAATATDAAQDAAEWASSLVVEPKADDAERRDRAIRALTERRGGKKPRPPAAKAKPVPAEARATEVARAAESLTRHLEASRKGERVAAALTEQLDGFARAERQMADVAKRFSDLDQRDNALLALSRRLVDSQTKNEQRMSALTTAISLLADRVYTTEDQPAASGGDIDRSIASIIGALGTLAANMSGAPGAPPAPTGEDQPPDPDREAAGEAPPPPAPPPAAALPRFDYDTLNEKAMENTRRRK
ncbi:MAG: hypothetical protein IIA01_00025 [Proteobacteria bacterium]|nr:hypothetical protein [Pseudomonadota bacterium]